MSLDVLELIFLSSGFSNSNMNLPGREEQGPTTSSPQLQDKNANHRTSSPNSPIPAPMENGNQISNGNLQNLVASEQGYVLSLLQALSMKSHCGENLDAVSSVYKKCLD